MNSMIKYCFHKFFGRWTFIVFIIFIMYTIPILKTSKILDLSYWEFEILALTNMYYILFGLVLSYIVFVFKNLSKDEQEILIRTKRYTKYFIAQFISLFLISIVFVSAHLVVSMIMGFGLSFHNVFTNQDYEALKMSALYFNTPLAGVLSSLMYLTIGLSILGMFIMFLNHYLKKQYVVIIVMLLFILALLNSIIFLNKNAFPFIYLENYMLLSHGFNALGNRFYLLIVCELVFAVLMIFQIKKFWYKNDRKNS